MGYHTDISMNINTGKHSIADVIKAMEEILADTINVSAVVKQYQNMFHETHTYISIIEYELKWYDEDDENVMKLSELLPDAEFFIHGDGEIRDDVWEEKYKNGECKRRYQILTWTDWE